MSSLTFKATAVGLAAASSAADQGIRLRMTEFRVSSAYGYVVDGTETAMPGTTLYVGAITAYQEHPDGHVIFTCRIDPQAGPFDFGSVGLFNDAGVLVALAAFAAPQTKYSSLGSNVNSTFTFDCYLRLGQGTAIFEVSTAELPSTVVYGSWADVVPAASLPDPRINTFIVNELDSRGNLTTLTKKPGALGWSVQSTMHQLANSVPYTSGTSTFVDISSTVWASVVRRYPLNSSATLVVEFANSVFRKAVITTVGDPVSTVRLMWAQSISPAPAATGVINIHTNLMPGVDVIGDQDTTGNADTAAALQTGREIALTGDVEGSVEFDGSADVEIDVRIAPGSNLALKLAPTGSVTYYAGTTAPPGWLKANGAVLIPSEYPELYAVIGTTFGGGTGPDTFHLPDLRAEFIRGWDDGRGVDFNVNGAPRALGSSQTDEFKSHNHNGSTSTSGSHIHGGFDSAGFDNSGVGSLYRLTYDEGSPYNGYVVDLQAGAHSHTFTTDGTGGTETRPRNVALLAIIKY